MSTLFRVAIIGTGLPWRTEGATGFGMSRAHAPGYHKAGNCQIVALADLETARMQRFSNEFCDGKAELFTDYRAMLAEVKPDIVSIATWPQLHAEMTIAAAEAGVRAIHCEKPMAPTFGEAKRMAQVCAERGVQLTFNHQRRHLPTFQTACRLIRERKLGKIKRLEGTCSNMMDWGTHWLNMFQMLNEESAPVWVMGQVDARKPVSIFGVRHDTDGVCVVGYENGTFGMLYTGEYGAALVGCEIRVIGTEGELEIHNTAPHLRLRTNDASGWQDFYGPDTEGGLHGNEANADNVVDLVRCLESGARPLCDVSNALATTEVIFATYASARQRGRIELPLTSDDNPLDDLIDQGVFPGARG